MHFNKHPISNQSRTRRGRSRFFVYFFVSFSLVLSLPRLSWPAETVDHTWYADLLKKYVKDGVVNYQGFKDEENRLDAYLKVLEGTDTGKLSRDEQLAFYINAYNATTIKLILTAYPGVKSIRDLGGRIFNRVFSKKIVRIEGKTISLDDLEHGIIRPRFKEPRVHFAVNCASISCPPLISEPYQGSILDQQLDASTRAFLNNPQRNYLEGNKLYVSRIFKWFNEDFNDDVVGFFLKFADGELREKLTANRDKIKVKYLDYDWSLNGT
ncbi:MAG: DUF547 domain-containing protein [Desulfobacterales bacterium]|nr:MAG: DUF547 domain-containing protein [Desulfobacterales bacterium]